MSEKMWIGTQWTNSWRMVRAAFLALGECDVEGSNKVIVVAAEGRCQRAQKQGEEHHRVVKTGEKRHGEAAQSF
jgi:hypothetical protein